MITITYAHPDTGDDETWSLNVKSHAPFEEKRSVATADAGDYIAPEVVYKGSYDLTNLQTNPLPAADIDKFYLFRRATQKGREFVVEGSAVPLIGTDYIAIREGSIKPVSAHGGRYFTFKLSMRVVGVISGV